MHHPVRFYTCTLSANHTVFWFESGQVVVKNLLQNEASLPTIARLGLKQKTGYRKG
jgi:hypothetical protein